MIFWIRWKRNGSTLTIILDYVTVLPILEQKTFSVLFYFIFPTGLSIFSPAVFYEWLWSIQQFFALVLLAHLSQSFSSAASMMERWTRDKLWYSLDMQTWNKLLPHKHNSPVPNVQVKRWQKNYGRVFWKLFFCRMWKNWIIKNQFHLPIVQFDFLRFLLKKTTNLGVHNYYFGKVNFSSLVVKKHSVIKYWQLEYKWN